MALAVEQDEASSREAVAAPGTLEQWSQRNEERVGRGPKGDRRCRGRWESGASVEDDTLADEEAAVGAALGGSLFSKHSTIANVQ